MKKIYNREIIEIAILLMLRKNDTDELEYFFKMNDLVGLENFPEDFSIGDLRRKGDIEFKHKNVNGERTVFYSITNQGLKRLDLFFERFEIMSKIIEDTKVKAVSNPFKWSC